MTDEAIALNYVYADIRLSKDGKKHVVIVPINKDAEALDTAARITDKMNRLEADAKKHGELERLVMPIRKLYGDIIKRGAYSEAQALKLVVAEMITRPIPKSAT